jgi:hypothetical protein
VTDRLTAEISRINAEVRAKIRLMYTVEDEIQLLRTAPSPEFEVYNAYVESCLEWGRKQKEALLSH